MGFWKQWENETDSIWRKWTLNTIELCYVSLNLVKTSYILLPLTSNYISCILHFTTRKHHLQYKQTFTDALSLREALNGQNSWVGFTIHKYQFSSQLPLCIFFWGGIHKYNKKQKLILTSYSLLLSKLRVSSCISHHMISIIMVGVNE